MPEQIGAEAVLQLDGFDKGVKAYQAGLAKMGAATAKMAQTSAGHFQKFGGAALEATKVLGTATVAAAGLAGAAITKFAYDGIRSAADLDAQLSTIASVMSKTKDQVAPLNDLILQLGLDPTLKVTAAEAADAIENLARNGLSLTDIMDGAARGTVLLANATGADLGTAANIASSAMATFGIEAANMSDAVNGITSVTSNSKFGITDYSYALSQGGGAAVAAGVSFGDFNTAIAASANLFAAGGDAGTSFKTFLQRLTPQGGAAADAIKELNLQFYNADGSMRDMADISAQLNQALFGQVAVTQEVGGRTQEQNERYQYLGKTIAGIQKKLADYKSGLAGVAESENDKIVSQDRLNRQLQAAQAEYAKLSGIQGKLIQSTKTLTEEERQQYLTTIFGSDASRMAYGLAEQGAVIYTDVATAARELGVSQEEVNKVIEGGVTQFEALQLQMGLVDASKNAATNMDNLKGKLEILGGQVEAVQLSVGQKFLPVLSKLADIGNELATKYGPAVVAFFGSLAEALGTAVDAIMAGQSPIDTFMLAMGSFGTIGTQIAQNLVAMGASVSTFILNVQTATAPLVELVAQFVTWQDVLITVALAISAVVIPATIAWVVAMAPIILTTAAVLAAVVAMRIAWENNFLGIKDITAKVVAAVKAAIGPVSETLSNLATNVLPFLRENWDALAIGIGSFVAVIVAAQIPAIFAGMATAVSVAGTAIGAVLAALSAPVLLIGAAVALLAVGWNRNWFGMRDATYAAYEGVVAAITPMAAALAEFGSGALSEITAFVTGNDTEFTTLKSAWASATQGASDLFTNIAGYATTALPEWTSTLSEWAVAGAAWVLEAHTNALAYLGTWVTEIIDYVSTNAAGWIDTLAAWQAAASDWVYNAISAVVTALVSWWSTISSFVNTKLNAWKTILLGWSAAAWEWITDAVATVTIRLTTWWSTISTFATGKLTAWKTILIGWTTAAWQWITNAVSSVRTQISSWWTTISTFVSNKLTTWTTSFVGWTKAAWNWLVSAKEQTASALSDWWILLIGLVASYQVRWGEKFYGWSSAMSDWITGSASTLSVKVGEWFARLQAALPSTLENLKSEMLLFAAAMVTWLSDKAADALPALGTWLGKIVAWIPLGVLALGAALIKMTSALIGWITGSEDSADAKTPAALATFQTALTSGLDTVWKAIVKMAENFATSFMETLNEYVDWTSVGETIMGRIKLGIINIRTAIKLVITNLAQGLHDIFTAINWLQLGSDLITSISNGMGAIFETIKKKATDIAAALKKAFTDIKWLQLGKDILNGIMSGLDSLKQDLIDKMISIAQSLPNWVKWTLGIDSPSKVFIEIARNIIEGWLLGFKQSEDSLYAATRDLVNGVLHTVMQSAGDVRAAFASLAGGLSSSGSGFSGALDGEILRLQQIAETAGGQQMHDAIRQMHELQAAQANFGFRQGNYESLKRQLDLIDLLRDNGADVATVLSGIKMGIDVDNQSLLELTTRSLSAVNAQIEQQIYLAKQGYDKIVAQLHAGQLTSAQIEDKFTRQNIDQLQSYRDQITSLDAEIAAAETELLTLGGPGRLQHVRDLNKQRDALTGSLETYLAQVNRLEDTLTQIDVDTGSRAAAAISAFQDSLVAPLATMIRDQGLTEAARNELINLAASRVDVINEYGRSIRAVEQYETEIQDLLNNTSFGDTLKNNVEQVLDTLYAVGTSSADRTRLLGDLKAYTNQIGVLARYTQMPMSDASVLKVFQQTHVDDALKALLNFNLAASERNALTRQYTTAVQQLATIQQNSDNLSYLKDQQAFLQDIITLSETAGDSDMIRRIFLGIDARNGLSPEQLATVYGRYVSESVTAAQNSMLSGMEDIQRRLAISAYGFTDLIETLQATRKPLEDLEADASKQFAGSINALDAYRNRVAMLDQQIADTENQLLATGALTFATHLRQLNDLRGAAAKAFTTYIQDWREFSNLMATVTPISESLAGNERASRAVSHFIETQLNPLQEAFQNQYTSASSRDAMTETLRERIAMLQAYGAQVGRIADTEQRFATLAENDRFGAAIARNVKDAIESLYHVGLDPSRRQEIMTNLQAYEGQIKRLLTTYDSASSDLLGTLKERRLDPLINQLLRINLSMEERNRLTDEYLAAQARVGYVQAREKAISNVQERIDLMQKIRDLANDLGDKSIIEKILGGLDLRTVTSAKDLTEIIARYSDYALRLANYQLFDIANIKDYSREFGAVVDRAVTFDDIIKEFDRTPLAPEDQAKGYLEYYDQQIAALRELAAAGNESAVAQAKSIMVQRDRVVAFLRTYMDALYRADQHMARLQDAGNTHAESMATEFRKNMIDPLMDLIHMPMTDTQRAQNVALIGQRVDQLNSYIRQTNALATLQKDLSSIRGFNPIIERYASQRLDPLLEQIYDINTQEARRVELVKQYRAEQEKVYALQQKQQQLEFLQMQFNLVDQVRQLNDQYDELIPMQSILDGITFGVNASMDDMMTLMSRVINAMITTANADLGIHSPSKVFAEMAQHSMEGLGQGFLQFASLPLNALMSAIRPLSNSDIFSNLARQSVESLASNMERVASISSQSIMGSVSPLPATVNRSATVNFGGVNISNGMDMRMFEDRIRFVVGNMF